MCVLFDLSLIIFFFSLLSFDDRNKCFEHSFFNIWLNSFQKFIFKGFFCSLLIFRIIVVHPVNISYFFKKISHPFFKIFKISFLIFTFEIYFIFDLIDKSHDQVIVIPIIPVFKLHITWHDVIIRQSFDIVNFIHQLFQLFVHLRTLLLGIFRSYVVKNFVLNVTVQLLEFVIV